MMRTSLSYLFVVASLGAAYAGYCDQGTSSRLGSTYLAGTAKPFLNMPANEHGPIPVLLSQTGAFSDLHTLKPSPALVAYDLNVPFWADGADKRRWISVPSGSSIHFAPSAEWTFPDGTVFIKHFALKGRRLETRLLVRGAGGGIYGMSYRWRNDQREADAIKQGNSADITYKSDSEERVQPWYFPGPEDCRKCHLPVAGGVLGVNTRQLNRACAEGAENQLVAWGKMGLLDRAILDTETAKLSKLPGLEQRGASPEERARAYLDVNCGYCHRPGGAAVDFDARYDTPLRQQALVNAPARINFGIDRARQIAPNDPWRSMVLIRLATHEQTRMPPLGPLQIDGRGTRILREWITSLSGPPVVAPPRIEPKGSDFKGEMRVSITHQDPGVEIRYTLDGSPPGQTATLYSQPLQLTNSATVRARAFKTDHVRSIVVQETFISLD